MLHGFSVELYIVEKRNSNGLKDIQISARHICSIYRFVFALLHCSRSNGVVQVAIVYAMKYS